MGITLLDVELISSEVSKETIKIVVNFIYEFTSDFRWIITIFTNKRGVENGCNNYVE